MAGTPALHRGASGVHFSHSGFPIPVSLASTQAAPPDAVQPHHRKANGQRGAGRVAQEGEGEPAEAAGVPWWQALTLSQLLGQHARVSCQRPWQVLLCGAAMLTAVLAIVFGTHTFRLTDTPTGSEWRLPYSELTSREDAAAAAQAALQAQWAPAAQQQGADAGSLGLDTFFVYHSKSGNMLTPANLGGMRAIEQSLLAAPAYPKYCLEAYNGTQPLGCATPASLLTVMYDPAPPSFYGFTGYGASQAPGFDARVAFMAGAPGTFGFFFNKGFGPGNLNAEYVRSLLPLGAPLFGYTSATDRPREQAKAAMKGLLTPVGLALQHLTGMHKSKVTAHSAYLSASTAPGTGGDVEVLWYSQQAASVEVAAIFGGDIFQAIFAGMGMWIHVAIGTRSMLLAAMVVVQAVVAVPVAHLFYRLIFQVDYFGALQLGAFYLLLGISCDYVFLYFDAYMQSLIEPLVAATLATRITYMCQRATPAIMSASATTAAALFAMAASPLMPVKAYALFAGMGILAIALLATTLFPAVLVIWSQVWEELPCCVCFPWMLRRKYADRLDDRKERRRLSVIATVAGAPLEEVQEAMRRPAQQHMVGDVTDAPATGTGPSGSAPQPVRGSELQKRAARLSIVTEDPQQRRPRFHAPRASLAYAEAFNGVIIGQARRASVHLAGQRAARVSVINLNVLAPPPLEPVKPGRVDKSASFLASAAALLGIAAPTVSGGGAPSISLTATSATPDPAADSEAARETAPARKTVRPHAVRFGGDPEPGDDAQATHAAGSEPRLSVWTPEGRGRATQHLRASVICATRNVRSSVAQVTRNARASVAQATWNARASVYVATTKAVNIAAGGELRRQGIIDLRPMEKMFAGGWHDMLARRPRVIAAAFACIWVIGVTMLTQVHAPEVPPPALPPNHMFQRVLDLAASPIGPFAPVDGITAPQVRLIWGLNGMDYSGKALWDPTDCGDLSFDNGFDPCSAEAQVFLLQVCTAARDAACNAPACAGGRLVRPGEGLCFAEGLQAWLRASNATLPLPRTQFLSALLTFASLPAMQAAYPGQLGIMRDASGVVGLRFIQMVFNATFPLTLPYSQAGAVLHAWESFTRSLNRLAPPGVANAFQTLPGAWTTYQTAQALVYGTAGGLGLALAVVFIALNIVTGNQRAAALATFCIVGTFSSAAGIGGAMLYWRLGVPVAIPITLILAYSIDHCLYVAVAYCGSYSASRNDRTRDAMTAMGISVNAGCFGKLNVGVPLFSCIMPVFRHMGFAACWTGLVGYFWACAALPALLLLAGPEGDAGDWAATAQGLAQRAHAACPRLFSVGWHAVTWIRSTVAAVDAAWHRATAPRPAGRDRVGARAGNSVIMTRNALAEGPRVEEHSAPEVQVGDADFHFVGLPAVVEVPALRGEGAGSVGRAWEGASAAPAHANGAGARASQREAGAPPAGAAGQAPGESEPLEPLRPTLAWLVARGCYPRT
ncbi:hypothetical protein WJX81_003463 [Elliptochloris bilobata]|uniref:SSD domain-containing protein n=1 Tax=Elliptochloris bilobata TaxID=381761 RepID=A0AAW1S2D5_9CHLO